MCFSNLKLSFVFAVLLSAGFIAGAHAAELSILDFGATADDYTDDDSIAINLAIQAAHEGDTILVNRGKYHIKNEIILKDHINLKGEGTSLSVIASIFYGKDRSLITGRYVTDVTIDNLTLKANHSRGIGRLIDIRYGDRLTISNTHFSRFILHAVYFNSTSEGRVINSLFKEASETEIGGHGYGVIYTNGSQHGRVEGSDFIGPHIRHGVVIQGDKRTPGQNPSHNIVIAGNYFKHTTQDAIDLHGSGEYDNLIVNNVIDGDPSSSTIGRGIGVGEDVHGPSGEGNVIADNIIRNTRYGIHVLTGSQKVTIRDNIIEGCKRYGIYVQNGSDLTVWDNQISGCGKWGIYIEEGDDIKIKKAYTGNQVTQNVLGALYVAPDVSSMYVSDNDFCLNEGDNSYTEGNGTFLNNLCP
jgi:parallel beta-helix repeat protein